MGCLHSLLHCGSRCPPPQPSASMQHSLACGSARLMLSAAMCNSSLLLVVAAVVVVLLLPVVVVVGA